MIKLVLVRHGESLWNKENRFTGWTDIDLSEKGMQEALNAGKILKEEGYTFDVAYTSVLKRAIRTLWIILDEMDMMWLTVFRTWRLNEKHYGELQGLNKREMAEKYGEEQVHLWRRSYDVRPPALKPEDPRFSGNHLCYKHVDKHLIPLTESLKDTVARFIPLWNEVLTPALKSDKKILIAAHGNSLRAVVKLLDNISDDDINQLNIPTGVPLVYELDDNLKPIKHYYLGDPDEIAKAINAVASQGKKQ